MKKTLKELLDKLSEKSTESYYNPYQLFQWPDSLADDQLWMSKELLTIHNTDLESALSDEQFIQLSKWESINFYSLNVHGIRELLLFVMSCVDTPGFEEASDYFHHFLGEENEHMWFFAQFCNRYGKKIYPSFKFKTADSQDSTITSLIAFSKIMIFEEIGDFFNQKMMNDESLHPTIRLINKIHHMDESRHIAMGRQIIVLLFDRIKPNLSEHTHKSIQDYLIRYMNHSIETLYNPRVYIDAGLDKPYELRKKLLADKNRIEMHKNFLKRTLSFYKRNQIII